jgi:hypothetical protein
MPANAKPASTTPLRRVREQEPPGEAVAGLWRSTLRAEGIHSVAKNVSSLALYGVPAFEVWVQHKDVRRACELLGLDGEVGPNVSQDR